MLYAYAIDACAGTVPYVEGFHGRAVHGVTAGGLRAAVSDGCEAPPQPTEPNLWTHERVVDALMRERTVLPMRFGTVLADAAEIRSLLRERQDELQAALARVDGAIELGVRGAWRDAADTRRDPSAAPAGADTPGVSPAPAGADYMASLVERRRRAQELADLVDEPLRALSRDSTRRILVSPNLPLSGAYLVSRERLDEFQARVDRLEREIDGAAIVCTGPWAPYGFTDSEATSS